MRLRPRRSPPQSRRATRDAVPKLGWARPGAEHARGTGCSSRRVRRRACQGRMRGPPARTSQRRPRPRPPPFRWRHRPVNSATTAQLTATSRSQNCLRHKVRQLVRRRVRIPRSSLQGGLPLPRRPLPIALVHLHLRRRVLLLRLLRLRAVPPHCYRGYLRRQRLACAARRGRQRERVEDLVVIEHLGGRRRERKRRLSTRLAPPAPSPPSSGSLP